MVALIFSTISLAQLIIAKKMAAGRFYLKFYLNSSNEKFDLSTYVLADNTLFLLISMPQNNNLMMTVFKHIKSTFCKGSW